MFNFNFRNLIPWASPTDYQKLSEDLYAAHTQLKKERQMSETGEFSYSVGPSTTFDGGAAITFKQEGGMTTTIELGYKHVQTLINLLETVMESQGDSNE